MIQIPSGQPPGPVVFFVDLPDVLKSERTLVGDNGREVLIDEDW